jgi:alkylation response protein AidB-like acyl-CoA dehydrogenase
MWPWALERAPRCGSRQRGGRLALPALTNTLQGLWETASQGQRFKPWQQARLRLAATFAIHQARDVVDACYHAAGATAIFADNTFERHFRDIHTISQQVQAHATVFEQVRQTLLGLTPAPR